MIEKGGGGAFDNKPKDLRAVRPSPGLAAARDPLESHSPHFIAVSILSILWKTREVLLNLGSVMLTLKSETSNCQNSFGNT